MIFILNGEILHLLSHSRVSTIPLTESVLGAMLECLPPRTPTCTFLSKFLELGSELRRGLGVGLGPKYYFPGVRPLAQNLRLR